VTVNGFSDPLSNPLIFDVRVDDLELSGQVGSGVNPPTLGMWVTCSALGEPIPGYPGCTLSGRAADGRTLTSLPDVAHVTAMLQVAGPGPNGVFTWTPNNASVTVNTAGASAVQISGWVEVRDRAGNFRYYPLPTSTLGAN
jgi:hypothetical protein